MRYDSEHKQRTRERVLSEAAAAIRTFGPNGIGVADLMAKAGLTHGGFYAHFKSKDDLIAHAISYMFDEMYERFLAGTEDPDVVVALGKFLDLYLSPRHRDAPERGCPLPCLAGDLPRLPGAARERFEAGLERLTRAIAKRLKELGIAGADRVSASVIAELVGALALARAIKDPAASERVLRTSRDSIKARLGLKTTQT
jgi:TetR/AcrR family transcriptional regulator, transcriptional repressor for nem operon